MTLDFRDMTNGNCCHSVTALGIGRNDHNRSPTCNRNRIGVLHVEKGSVGEKYRERRKGALGDELREVFACHIFVYQE